MLDYIKDLIRRFCGKYGENKVKISFTVNEVEYKEVKYMTKFDEDGIRITTIIMKDFEPSLYTFTVSNGDNNE